MFSVVSVCPRVVFLSHDTLGQSPTSPLPLSPVWIRSGRNGQEGEILSKGKQIRFYNNSQNTLGKWFKIPHATKLVQVWL